MRSRLALVAVAAVAIAGLWFVGLWRPQSGNLTDARDRRTAAEARVTTLDAKLSSLRAAAANASQVELDGGRLRAAMPDDAQLALLLLQANDAAIRSGVQYLTVTPTPPAAPSTPGTAAEIKLSIDVTGRYGQLLDFLDRLADMPRAMVVDTISMTPEGQGAGATLRAAIAGRVFTTQGMTPTSVPDTGATP